MTQWIIVFVCLCPRLAKPTVFVCFCCEQVLWRWHLIYSKTGGTGHGTTCAVESLDLRFQNTSAKSDVTKAIMLPSHPFLSRLASDRLTQTGWPQDGWKHLKTMILHFFPAWLKVLEMCQSNMSQPIVQPVQTNQIQILCRQLSLTTPSTLCFQVPPASA